MAAQDVKRDLDLPFRSLKAHLTLAALHAKEARRAGVLCHSDEVLRLLCSLSPSQKCLSDRGIPAIACYTALCRANDNSR